MPVIGIVDDRSDVREIMVDSLSLALPDSWHVLSTDPLSQLSEYPSWIAANKVSVLIIDERLNEAAISPLGSVSYFGHDLAQYLRQRMETFPIFVVTSYPDDEDLRERFADVEDIIDRTLFGRLPDSYAARFARASQRYLETFENELADLSSIASKVATGEEISDSEISRARAIQGKLNIAFAFDEIANRSQWISEMESTIQDFDHLKKEIKSLLERRDSNEMEENT